MEIVSGNRLEILYAHFFKNISFTPFEPVQIVVPSSALREWLTYRLAKDRDILFGAEILLLEEALYKAVGGKSPPSYLSLALAIEPELDDVPELKAYLKTDKRRHALACRLARLFQKYSSNCPRMKTEWKTGWQARLFHKIFEKRPTLWEAVEAKNFYLFGISYLTPIEKKAFAKSRVWLFSPCLHYWEDQLSEKEQASLLRSYEKKGVKEHVLDDFEKTLEPIHPLLAEWGQLGKPMTLLDEHEKRLFIAPKKVVEGWDDEEEVALYEGEPSKLDRLKTEILYAKKGEWTLDDDSIAFTKYAGTKKEAEGLRKALLTLLNKGIEPKDILILTPSIEKTKGYLPLAFKEDIPYFVCDEGEEKEEDRLFITFWDIVLSGGKIKSVLEWTKEANVFDIDAFRKIDAILPREENFWDKAVAEVIGKMKQGEIDSSDIDPVRQFFLFYQKLSPLLKTKEKRTLKEWGAVFSAVLEWVNSTSAREAIRKLLQIDSSARYSFYTFYEHVKNGIKALQREPMALNLNSVRVSSLYPMRLVPAKAVILFGMSEESYPRNEVMEPLDESVAYAEERLPSKKELDLYLLLETLFQAQDYFWISYTQELSRPLLHLKELIHANETYIADSRLGSPLPKKELVSRKFTVEREQILRLEDIRSALANPIKTFFRKSLKVELTRPDEEEERLVANGLDKYLLRRSIGEQSDINLNVQGRFVEAQIENEQEARGDLAGQAYQIDPPVEIDGVRIYGTFPVTSNLGVHVLQANPEKRYEELFSIYLLGHIRGGSALYRQYQKKNSTMKSAPLPACQALLELYYRIHEELCPLEPEWIKLIAAGDEEGLGKKFKETSDPYHLLAIARGLTPAIAIRDWKETAETLKELIE